jgi:hypothetical protein
MNFIRKVFLRVSDPILKQCFWLRFYNKKSYRSSSPKWLNHLMYCDCEQEILRYRSAEHTYPSYLLQHSFLSCIEKRQQAGEKMRAYIQEHHDHKKTNAELLALYDALLTK